MTKNYHKMNSIFQRPKKSLGQNFLIDENIARKIVRTLLLTNEDHILEIGPGYGVLTKYIVPRVKKYIAVEIDRKLCDHLKDSYGKYNGFQLIEDDFLNIALTDLLDKEQKWKIVGNIPYHLTSPIIFKIFHEQQSIESLTLMVQKEVARRIVAKPHTKQYGILSVLSNLYTDVKIQFLVSRNVFLPKPGVDSAVVQWRFLPQTRFPLRDEVFFRTVLKAIFGQRRKIIRNSLKSLGIDVTALDFPLNRRPEQLTVAELVHLSNMVANGTERY